jgi:hypothetical protein
MAKNDNSPTVPFRQEIAEGYYGFSVPDQSDSKASPDVDYMVERSISLFRTLNKHQGIAQKDLEV